MAADRGAVDGGGAGGLRRGAPQGPDRNPGARGAGAGVGVLIGFVAVLAKAGSGWSAEPATSPACQTAVAESTAPAEGN